MDDYFKFWTEALTHDECVITAREYGDTVLTYKQNDLLAVDSLGTVHPLVTR